MHVGNKDHERIAVLASGGADSCILLSTLAEQYREVFPVYVRNGLLWEAVEVYWLKRFVRSIAISSIRPLSFLSLPMKDVYGQHWSLTGQSIPDGDSGWEEVYLPGRNLILLSKAVVYCALHDIPIIALGPLKTNQFTDSSDTFFRGFEQMARKALNTNLEIVTPLADQTKAEVIKTGSHLPLELTFSCISPQEKLHCGKCNKCVERMDAFKEAGLRDQTTYWGGL